MKHVGFLILAILATGCVRPVETRVSNIGENAPAGSSYYWGNSIVAGDANGATQLIEGRLAAKGIAKGDTAALRLDATFAALPASLNLQIGSGSKSAVGPARIKPPRQSGKCEPVEFRLGLTLSRLDNGAIYYQSSAAEYHCKGDLVAVLPLLVDAALVDIGRPKGTYKVLRKK
jgi:hypothetical protein